MAELWQIALVAVIIFIVVNLLFKTAKFLFKIIITLIIAGILYYLIT